MNRNEDMAEALRMAMDAVRKQREGLLSKPGTLLMNEQTHRHMVETGVLRRSAFADKHGDVLAPGGIQMVGIDVGYSPYIETGTVMYVERGRPFHPSPMVLDIERSFEQYVTAFFHRGVMSSGLYPSRFYWMRKDGESLVEWGKRLAALGLLDNPVYRWHYQQAVLSAPLRFIRRLLQKARARYGNPFTTG